MEFLGPAGVGEDLRYKKGSPFFVLSPISLVKTIAAFILLLAEVISDVFVDILVAAKAELSAAAAATAASFVAY